MPIVHHDLCFSLDQTQQNVFVQLILFNPYMNTRTCKLFKVLVGKSTATHFKFHHVIIKAIYIELILINIFFGNHAFKLKMDAYNHCLQYQLTIMYGIGSHHPTQNTRSDFPLK
jgi:hypothetical protein